MRTRSIVGAICILAGCQSTKNDNRVAEVPLPASPPIVEAAVEEPAAKTPEKPLAAIPVSSKGKAEAATVDHLMVAAECLERHDTATAAEHLRSHIEANPQQIMIRAYLAEMLFKASVLDEAQWQFERFIADAQTATGPAHRHLLRCHTRLMEIAEAKGDGPAEHLQRGIGLYLLAGESREREAAVEENLPERMFLKAAEELKIARKLSPQDARPAWYLSRCWAELNQSEAARLALKEATARIDTSTLTPGERRDLRNAATGETLR